jgi:GAF domain-containing protein/HAMP domain-containing protein
MISTILTSLHTFTALVLLGLAALTYLTGPRSRKSISTSLLLVGFASASIALGLAFNSYTVGQVLPWIFVLIFSTYPIAPAAVLVTIMLLRPNLAKNRRISIPLWIAILLPAALIILDLTNTSQELFSSNLLIDLEPLFNLYTGGYISTEAISTSAGVGFLRSYLFIFYFMLMIIAAIVTAVDWKSDKFNRVNGGILFGVTLFGSIASTVFQDLLPQTVAAMLTNATIALGFFVVSLRVATRDKPEGNPWLQNILDNYPMGTKITSMLALLLIPAIAFLSFSTFSLFQTSLITTGTENLNSLAKNQALLITNVLEERIEEILQLNDTGRINTQLNDRTVEYEGQNLTQIQDQIQEFNRLWLDQDQVLISDILSPVKHIEMRLLIEANPVFGQFVLVDNHGGLITATQNPGKYDFTDEIWYLSVVDDRTSYVGQITWDEVKQSYQTEVAVPMYTFDGEFAGILMTDYSLDEVLGTITQEDEGQVNYGLTTTSGVLIPAGGTIDDEVAIPLAALSEPDESLAWRAFRIDDISSLIETSQVSSENLGFEAPWVVTAYQPVEIVTESLNFARTTTVVIAIVIAVLSALIVGFLTQTITTPLVKLQTAAKEIEAGKPGAIANLTSKDEFGELAKAFNQMSSELKQMVTGLEETIAERTQDLEKRASQLEASAIVARQAAEVQDMTSLLNLVTRLIPDAFGYYHSGIFLLDEQRKYAVLEAANSEGGQAMLKRGHKLQIGRVGVVGYCAGSGQARIAQDVGADVVYYANPDMPETRSEMALPLIVRENIIGVLDIQSTEANAFDNEDIEVVQVLADQLALAIDNVRLMESSQRALKELQILYGEEASKSWKDRLAGSELAFAYDSTGLMRSASTMKVEPGEEKKQLSKPIRFRGQVIGNLDFIRDENEGAWTEEEQELIDDILEQTALALENARLVQQIRLRSDQIRLLQEITAMAASIIDEDELLESIAQKLQTSLQARHCGVVLREEDTERFTLVASVMEGDSDVMVGNQLKIEEDLITQAIVEAAENVVFNKVVGDPKYQVFVQTFSSKKPAGIVTLPLIIRDVVVGYIFLEDRDETKVLDQEEDDLFTQITAQISTAIESARLFKAEQQGRIAAAALLEITQIASASLDINRVLNQATNRSAQAIQAHRCSILLLDEKEKIKPLVSIFATGEAVEGEEWERLQTKIRETYQRTPLRRLASNMREVTIVHDPPAYKPFPLDWTADFNIHSLLMVPLISQNRVIGTMLYDQIDPNYGFRESQVELAQTIAGQIATTIENANLFEQAVTRAERERQITEITAKIRSSNDPEKIMETAITELRAALAQSTIKARQTAQKSKAADKNGKEI